MELLWFYVAVVLAISDVLHTQVMWKLFNNYYILLGGLIKETVHTPFRTWLVHEIMEAIFHFIVITIELFAVDEELYLRRDRVGGTDIAADIGAADAVVLPHGEIQLVKAEIAIPEEAVCEIGAFARRRVHPDDLSVLDAPGGDITVLHRLTEGGVQ